MCSFAYLHAGSPTVSKNRQVPPFMQKSPAIGQGCSCRGHDAVAVIRQDTISLLHACDITITKETYFPSCRLCRREDRYETSRTYAVTSRRTVFENDYPLMMTKRVALFVKKFDMKEINIIVRRGPRRELRRSKSRRKEIPSASGLGEAEVSRWHFALLDRCENFES